MGRTTPEAPWVGIGKPPGIEFPLRSGGCGGPEPGYDQICWRSLAFFLWNRKEPTLQFPGLGRPNSGSGAYEEIFARLRSLPIEVQERLLVEYFTTFPDFPNQNEEPLGRFLVKVNNLPWLQPNEEPSLSLLQNFADQHLLRLNLAPLPVSIIRHN